MLKWMVESTTRRMVISNCLFMGKFLVYERVLLIVDERYLGVYKIPGVYTFFSFFFIRPDWPPVIPKQLTDYYGHSDIVVLNAKVQKIQKEQPINIKNTYSIFLYTNIYPIKMTINSFTFLKFTWYIFQWLRGRNSSDFTGLETLSLKIPHSDIYWFTTPTCT